MVDSLLGGEENLKVIVAFCLLGHHISQGLWMCSGMENWLKHLCLLELFLVMGQDVFAHVQYQYEKVWCCRVFLVCLS